MVDSSSARREALAALTEQWRDLARAEERRTRLTGTGAARDGRVRVMVDANGTVTDIRFSSTIDDLSYREIAKAAVAAASAAAADLERKRQELFDPLITQQSPLPDPSMILERLPDLETLMPEGLSAWLPSLSARHAAVVNDTATSSDARRSAVADNDHPDQATEFTDVEQQRRSGRGVRDDSW
ncbi:YbaB/EbfC family nucleoid-associated protein [Nocardia sp. NBC_00881]|uniref:YbaB/EbfC family nucleoid-associated protein n=1 Tax=Nocardia sp. NBC_00881 TaxID=2975995 RepID=UPI00386DCFF5|nr:YbaB/EbfC family nucleoid-associated protein [Nocardia sp. NBC_00881]